MMNPFRDVLYDPGKLPAGMTPNTTESPLWGPSTQGPGFDDVVIYRHA